MPWKDLTSDVAELFGELQSDVEVALYRAWQHRNGVRRASLKLDHAQRRVKSRAQQRYMKTPQGRAKRKCYKARVDERIKALRAARPRVVIPPVGRPPELEARIQQARAELLKVQRRQKIAALATSRLRTRVGTSLARQGRVDNRRAS